MEPKTEKAVRYKVRCLWGKADKEFKRRLYSRAALTLTEALREIPPSLFTNCKGLIAELFWKRGHVYKQDTRILEAAQDFNEALDINENIGILDPDSCRSFLRESHRLLNLGNWGEPKDALCIFRAVLSACPTPGCRKYPYVTQEFESEINCNAVCGIGVSAFKCDDPKQARDAFLTVFNHGGSQTLLETADHWMSKGEELFNNEYFAVANTNFNLAENICNVLLEKDRFDFMAKKLLGNVLGKRAVNHFCWSEDKSEAIKDRDRSFALRLRPPSPLEKQFIHWRGKGREDQIKGRIKPAIKAFKISLFLSSKLETSKNDIRQIQCSLVDIYMDKQKFEEALQLMVEIVESHKEPNKIISNKWKSYGSVFYKQEEYSLAQRVYSYAISLCPKDEKALLSSLYSNRSFMNIFLKRYQNAMDDAKKCIKLNPTWSKGYYRHGKSLYYMKEYEEAYSEFIRSFELVSNERDKLDTLKEVFKAIAELDDTSTTIPSNNLHLEFNVINVIIEELCDEAKDESWKAIGAIYLHTPFTDKLNAKNVPIDTMLSIGCHDSILSKLLEAGADANGYTAGHSPKGTRSPLDIAFEKSRYRAAALLIKYGAKIYKYVSTKRDEPKLHTILRIAIERGKVDLLREGIKILDPLIEDDAGNTLLHLLAMGSASPAKIRSLEIVTEFPLINPNIKNKQGKRAIDIIVRKDDIRRKMLAVSEKAPVTAAANSNDATNSSKKKKRKRKKKEKVKENCETAERPLDNEEDEAEDYLQQSAGKSETESLRQKIPSPYEEAKESVKRHVCEFDISKIVENQTFPGKLDVTKTNSNIQNGGTCNEEKTTENHDTQQSVNEDEGKAKEDLEVNPDDEMLVSDKDEIEDELEENDFDDLEGNIFEGLAWEVECTAEVWKTLRGRRLQPYLKKKIINKIRMLATGDWRPELAIRLEGISRDKNIRLYEAKLTKGARILWEEAIAFSPRCSMDPEIRLRLGKKEGRIYTDIIRIWDIALNHSAVPHTIDRIVKSHDRGLTCDIQKKLKGLKQDAMEIQQDRERIPNIYVDVEEERKLSELEAVNEMCKKDIEKWQELFFPPASPNDREYHILKFYAFTSAMANSILHVTDHTFDFPFQVSELEHAVISLDPEMQCALLLLGRSGTGKTTCCLYRLWRRFQVYWQSAITAGPYIPRLPVVRWAGDVQNDKESDLVDREGKASDDDTITSHRPVLLSCGCTDVCECVLATFRAMSGDEDRTMNENQDLQFTNEHEKNNAKEITPEFDIIESQDDSKEDEKQFEHLRQIFITKNAVLCHEVKKNFQELSHASPEAKQHVETEDEPMPNKLDNIDAAFFPLFLSSKELLLLLDASLPGETFFPRDDEGNLLVSVPGWGENDNHLSFLPTLESDVDEFESEDEYDAGTETESKPPEGTMREITYNVFVLEIWARMLRKQDISYHPSLVWTEIRSFIKGSVETLLTTSGYLSLEEYLDLGRKRAPNFTANRQTIYEMFLIYQKIKVQRVLFDEADVLFNVYQRIRNVVLPNWAFHEVYVDETQDFTQAELFTLIRCCRNPNTMFFTGDTAQSIMRGVSFRFSDLKTLFYSTKQALKSVKIMEKVGIPRRVYQLTHNYRSHKGILDLAASVIDILGHFFPESFDQLKRDVGLFPGPKPVILETSNFSDLAVLLKGSQRKTSVIEFGAHQVVLVATEESKHTLPEELRYALVLSIYEAKGLEFDDVLLYNFFKDSQARKEWRVITTFLNDMLESSEPSVNTSGTGLISREESELEFKSRPLEFDSNKHRILNSELKQLYTALTRARVNVWIYDEDLENRAPVFDYFIRRGLVELVRLGDDQRTHDSMERMFAEQSTTQDWDSRGLYFFEKELWQVALKCFERSGNQSMLDKCCAHVQAVKAFEMATVWRERRVGTLKEIQIEYMKAASMYLTCGLADEAVICLRNSKEWIIVGDLCRKLGRFGEAGKYYAKANHMIDASDCFRKAKDYFSAVDAMYRANHIAECIQLVREYHTLIAQGTVQGVKPPRSTLTLERLCTEAAEEAHRRRDYITMRDFIRSMPSVTSQLEFAKSKGCTKAVVEILMEQKRGEEAAQILIQKEKYVNAVKCTENKVTIALCYLENSRILFHHWLRMGRNGYLENCELEELILPSIENVLSLLQDTGDKNLQSKAMLADALYMKSCLTGETDYAREALEIYSQTNNAVGAFLSNLFIYEEEKNISESFLKSLSQIMDLLASLLSLRRLTERQQNLVVECAHYVGYETVFDKGTLTGLILRNNYKMFTVSSQLAVESSTIRNPLEGSDLFGDVSSAKSCMAAMLLERVSEVLVRLRGSLQREQKSKKPCSRFLSGILHKQEECSLPHLTPTLESFKQVTEPLFKLMWLDNICRCFVAKLGEADKRPFDNHYSALIKKLSTPSSMIKTCDDFYNLFCDHTKFLTQHNLKAVNIKAVLKDQNPVIRDQIRWYIEYYCSEQEEENFLSDVNLFLKITSLSQLLGFHFPLSEIKVNKLRQKIQDKYRSNPPPRNVGVFWSGNRQCYELLHEGYIESMHFLYEKRNIIEGLYYFVIRFLHRAVSMTKNLRPPTLLNTSMLLEFHMSLCMMSLCRLSPNANLKIVLPDYYIQCLRLSSSLHAMCHSRSYDPFNSIAFIRDGKEDRLVNFFRAGIELMCGKTSEIFDMFFLSFLEAREGSHDISERFWILVLVLLCNSDALKILLEAVYPLATAMFENIPKMMSLQGKMPERLATALTKAYYTKTGLQVLPILDSLLNNSGGSLVSCQWRLDAKKMWFSGFNPKDIVPKAVLKRDQTHIQLQQKDLDAVKMETVDDVPLTVQPAVADFSNAASSSVLHVTEEVVPPARIEVADDNDSTLRDLKEVDGRDMLPPIISKAPDHKDVASSVYLHTDRNASKDESFFIPSIAGAANDEDNSAKRIYNDHPYRPEFGTDKDDSEQSLTISHLEYVENLEIYELDHQEFVEKDFKRAVLVIEQWYKERRLRRKQEIAACTIQRWFRKLQMTKEESGSDEVRSGFDGLLDDQLGQSSKDLTKDHNDYMDYYRCRVCDITFQEESSISTNEQQETYKNHLLDGSNHWKVVKDYEEFVSFRDRFVIPFIAEAEKLKDRVDALSDQGFIFSHLPELDKLEESLQQVRQMKDEIQRQCQWNRQDKIEAFAKSLQSACSDLESFITKRERKAGAGRGRPRGVDKNENNWPDKEIDCYMDNFQDTRKKGGRNFRPGGRTINKGRGRGRGRGRGNRQSFNRAKDRG